MQGQLSQKERMLLEDLKKEEDLCVIKYQNYAQQAQDSNLSQLFNQIASAEKKHYDTVNSLLQGNGQSSQQGQSGQQSQSGQQGQGAKMSQATGKINLSQMGSGNSSQMNSGGSSSDKYMLQDMLSTEKYVSSAYDTSVFESAQPNVRQTLQKIQQEEQNHGEQLYQYMSSHGMYQTQ